MIQFDNQPLILLLLRLGVCVTSAATLNILESAVPLEMCIVLSVGRRATSPRDPSGYNVAEPNRRAREMEPAQSVTDPPHHAKIDVRINNVNMTGLIDSGSTSSFLHPCVIKQLVSTSDLAPAPKELSTHNYSSLPPVTPPDVPSPSDDLPVAHGIEDSKHTPEKQDNLSYNPGVAHRPQDGEPLKPEDNLALESLRRSSRVRKPVDRLTYY
ncbi:hypothetical protein Pmani_031251 [Petrolisthes manimaculis]|uniref:Uncharacterized protein n=1 Tax=Petrolisthes manimaculis TaxID=1843537 RepID=A0AAE1TSP8_9EUCA|nr:hypothetical protein Pmani_031251 [Petrolisthes manimaculis]